MCVWSPAVYIDPCSLYTPLQCMVSCCLYMYCPAVCGLHAGSVWSQPVQEHALSSPDPQLNGRMSVEIYQFVFILALCTILHKCTSIRGLCVCEAHLSICVDSVAPRAAAPGAVGKAGSRELPAHYRSLPAHLFVSSFQPNVLFCHSISPLKCS